MERTITLAPILGRPRLLGPGHNPYIIAEIGGNHDGNLQKALLLVEQAALAGADCVKFQIIKSEKLLSDQEKTFPAVRGFKNQLERQKSVELGWDMFSVLAKRCTELGIHFSASAFHEEAIDLLVDELQAPFIKIASGDVTNIPLLEKAATKNVPIIMSTAGCESHLIKKAMEVLKGKEVVLLHCTLPYPTPHEDIGLDRMNALAKEFDVLVGYSDHTTTIDACVGASYLGASVIEKHVASNNGFLCTGDHKVSAEFDELRDLVRLTKRAILHRGRGTTSDDFLSLESKTFAHEKMRRALYLAEDIKAGEVISTKHLSSLRPEAKGIPMYEWNTVLGKKVNKNKEKHTFLTKEDLE